MLVGDIYGGFIISDDLLSFEARPVSKGRAALFGDARKIALQ